MTLGELLKFNGEVNAFDYFFIVDKTDRCFQTCRVVTADFCITDDSILPLMVLKTRTVKDAEIPGICEKEWRGLVVEVSGEPEEPEEPEII